MLAELARYYHMEVSLDDPRYTAAISKLQADDQHRNDSDFTLTDVQERKWNLKSLRGKVVLVNFWATWCRLAVEKFRIWMHSTSVSETRVW